MSQLIWIVPLMILSGFVAMILGATLARLLFLAGERTGINKLIYRYLEWLGF